ncbi:MAG: transcriptional repressor LexA [Gammaproteobacteria bacterium]|nr:transcriptional repressor LexA [Gammaproteobacteria bacterium]
MLTNQEHKTLQFIRNYLAQYGYAPKFKEIGLAIGVTSQGVVHRYVQALEDKGYIDRVKGNARGMSLVELPLVSAPTIPLVGRIAAGLPIEAIEDQQELNLSEMFMGPELFALRVTGDSMMEAGIMDNDYVIIKKQPVANNGDIVVAMVDKVEATLKRFKWRSKTEVALIPENAEMETMVYPAKRVTIHGILVGQMRHYR